MALEGRFEDRLSLAGVGASLQARITRAFPGTACRYRAPVCDVAGEQTAREPRLSRALNFPLVTYNVNPVGVAFLKTPRE